MNILDLRIVTMDLTGEFAPKQFFVSSYPNARIVYADGREEHRNIGFDDEMLAKLRSAGDLQTVTVEIETQPGTTIAHVRQVFLPGQDVVPTRVGPANEDGEVSFVRRLDDQIEVGRTNIDYRDQGFRLSGTDLSVTIDGDDRENRIHFDPAMLDEMIDGLIMLRALRYGGAPLDAAIPAPAPAPTTSAGTHLADAMEIIARHDPKLAYETLLQVKQDKYLRNAGDLAENARHIDADGNHLSPTLGWINGEGNGAIVVFTYPDCTVTAEIFGTDTKLVYCPNVVVGTPYFVSDPNLDPLRITGRFGEIEDYEGERLFEVLVDAKLIQKTMPYPAYNSWLGLHGADEEFLLTKDHHLGQDN